MTRKSTKIAGYTLATKTFWTVKTGCTHWMVGTKIAQKAYKITEKHILRLEWE